MTESLTAEFTPTEKVNDETRLARTWQTVSLLFPSDVYRSPRQAIIVRYLADRSEFGRDEFRPETAAWTIIRRLYDGSLPPDKARQRFNSLPKEKQRAVSRYLGDTINASLLMLSQIEPISVDTGYGKVHLSYQKTMWEGVGGVAVKLQENGQLTPAYIVRGNPVVSEDSLRFDIRTLQPWVAEQEPSVKGLGDTANPLHDNYKEIIHDRTRLVDRFRRNILDHGGKGMATEEAILLMVLCFLQRNGFNQFCGIGHDQFPCNNHVDMCLNYDKLFSPFFRKVTTSQYRYTLDCHNSLCYVPNVNRIPDKLKAVLASIFFK